MTALYPQVMTPALAEVLCQSAHELRPVWMALRETGAEIRTRYEDEVAAALHFLIPFAIEHGDNWRAHAADRLLDRRAGKLPPSDRDQPLTIEIMHSRLVVSIGVDALMTAVKGGDDWDEGWEILDSDVFAAEIAHELENNEQEDGTTDIHLAIDKAATHAIENGSRAVRIDGEGEA